MGHSFKIGILFVLSVIAITGFSQEAFSGTFGCGDVIFPLSGIGDTDTFVEFTTPGADQLQDSACLNFTPGDGILERNFDNFPDFSNGVENPATFMEWGVLVADTLPPNESITSYKQTIFRSGTADIGHWVSAFIQLDDASTCSLGIPDLPALTKTCGDITITISSSGGDPAGSNDILFFEFQNNPQGPGEVFFVQNELQFLGETTGGTLTMIVHDLANTDQLPVGSTSIPLDSTPMLVAGSEMNSMWITLSIIAAVGVGVVIVTKRLKN